MKYGVLWRKTTKNIGDDIQSYAESLWYPRVDYMIDIENLDGFRAADDEPVACIMSAWYLWHKWNWPPSRSIYPLWIGFHYNDNLRGRASGMVSKWEYLTGPGYDYRAFLLNEARYSALTRSFPDRAEKLFAEVEDKSVERYEHLLRLKDLYVPAE